ncbi:MAG TPA: hypothetical protein VIP11_03845, partial [Gemmatimonadaceae bacterium]
MRFLPNRRASFAVAPAALLIAAASVPAQQAATPAAKGPTKQMAPADLKAWKTIRQATLSNDGKWLVYVIGPNEGDAQLVLRSTGTDAKETKFSIGDAPAGGGAPGAAGGGVVVSADSRWVAYTISPPSSAGRGGR